MFNVGPLELLVLAAVGLIVLGPDKLPGLAKDAARMLRTLRDLANGARTQLREELGPEFADMDLRSLNPKTAIQRALLGEDDPVPGPLATAVGSAGTLGSPGDAAAVRPPATTPLASDQPAPFDDETT